MSYSLGTSQAVLVMVFVGDKLRRQQYEFVPARVISDTLGIPRPTVSKMLRSLVGHGLLDSREGARGGVRLAVPPEQITLNDVLDAIEQKRPLFPRHVGVRAAGERPTEAQCAVADALDHAERAMRERLAGTRLSELLGRG